jgi:hypothetical protein
MIIPKEKDGSKARANAMRVVAAIANAHFKREPGAAPWSDPDPRDWTFIDVGPLLNPDGYFMPDYKFNAVWPIDVGLALPADAPGDFRLGYFRTIRPAEARGVATRVSPKMALAQSFDFMGGRYSRGGAFISQFAGKWVHACAGRGIVHEGVNHFDDVAATYVGEALRHRYEWSAIFQFPNGVRIRFGTDAQGAQALFKDRDRPAEGRRSPLLHWVRRHWRVKRQIQEISTHLRGRTTFEWRGLTTIIVPAEYELENMP